MGDLPKLSELFTEAISGHGKATADILTRVGQGQSVDWAAETMQCLNRMTQTGTRFIMFWDNIATLVARDPGGPLTFDPPKKCAPGEKLSFKLPITGMTTATAQSGLRRRGDPAFTIPASAITVTIVADGIALDVVCSGAPRGLYEGTLGLVDASAANAAPSKRLYNVYVEPA